MKLKKYRLVPTCMYSGTLYFAVEKRVKWLFFFDRWDFVTYIKATDATAFNPSAEDVVRHLQRPTIYITEEAI